MISNSILMNLITNNVLWHYESYDHKAAINELAETKINSNFYFIDNDLKSRHIIWRVGKLRKLSFDSDGFVEKMYIGHSSKYLKCFKINDIGEIIKPIINHYQDEDNLIGEGIAIDENIITSTEAYCKYMFKKK